MVFRRVCSSRPPSRLRDSDRLADTWHEREGGRLRYAYSPRFVLTATYDLLRSVGARARANHMLVHTHASEQREETDLVRQRFGVPNIQLLANLGLADTNACLAHCVWPEPEEFDVLASGGASVVHCPSCNMKLGSGVGADRRLPRTRRQCRARRGRRGVEQSARRLGGAAAGRAAGQVPRRADGVPPLDCSSSATLGGARALGLDADIGSIELGKFADLAVLDLRRTHALGPRTSTRSWSIRRARRMCATCSSAAKPWSTDGVLTAFSEADTLADAERSGRCL